MQIRNPVWADDVRDVPDDQADAWAQAGWVPAGADAPEPAPENDLGASAAIEKAKKAKKRTTAPKEHS